MSVNPPPSTFPSSSSSFRRNQQMRTGHRAAKINLTPPLCDIVCCVFLVSFSHSLLLRYPKPLAGQKEVAALKSKSAATLFTVTEGIIFPQRVIQNTASPEDKVVGAEDKHSEL